MAELAVQCVQVIQANHEQRAFDAESLADQPFAQLRQEMLARGQTGQGIEVDFLTNRLKARGLLAEQGFEAIHHAVHGANHAAQFGRTGLIDAQEAALGNGLGLSDHVTQGPRDDADGHRAHKARDDSAEHKPQQQLQRTFPEAGVGILLVARQYHGSILFPPVLDLRLAGRRLYRNHPGKPGRSALQFAGKGALHQDLAGRRDDAYEAVMACVKLC